MATTRSRHPRRDVVRLSPSGPEIDSVLLGAIEAVDSVAANVDVTIAAGDPSPIPRIKSPATATATALPGLLEVRFPAVRPGRRLVLSGIVSFSTTAPQVRIQLAASFDGGRTFSPIPAGEVNNIKIPSVPGSGVPAIGVPQLWPLLGAVDVPAPVPPATERAVVARVLIGGGEKISLAPDSQNQATWLVGLVVKKPAVDPSPPPAVVPIGG